MYIKVNHRQLENAASEIENATAMNAEYLQRAGNEVTALGSDWQGLDYRQYKIQWNTLTDRDSTPEFVAKTMQSYVEYLKNCAAQYKAAQANSINRANALQV